MRADGSKGEDFEVMHGYECVCKYEGEREGLWLRWLVT